MPSKKTLLIDFDGVLAEYKGWAEPEVLGEPLPGARAACFSLAKHYKLLCFTTRDRHFVEPWLAAHGFTCIEGVTNIKIPAFLQIDDRAVKFKGWNDDLLSRVKSFKPWWEEETHADQK